LCEYQYYQDRFGWRAADCPHAFEIGRRTVSLPLTAKMTEEDADYVIDAVTRTLVR
jgi:dTDP-4-amino-4,6-dideoxygalactose transaminase